MIVTTKPCIMCNNTGAIEVNEEHYNNWKKGTRIQIAFPELDADQRELLMTGIHAQCWEKIMENID